MSEHYDISVVMSTYNRCGMLAVAIDRILSQETGGASYQLIVVDNNSTDQTRQVVDSLMARGSRNLRYVFEPNQGVSYARNAGIAEAHSPIVAFLDDDVVADHNWIRTIKTTFDQHPEIACVGGRVLPDWESEPPSWLTSQHWAPVALQDYGATAFHIAGNNQLCLLSANFAFRREVFQVIGNFAPELQRVKNGIGSMEDLELLLRFWRAGLRAFYEPALTVTARVPVGRMTKGYHRKWHQGHGYFYSMLRSDEMERSSGRLFDVPFHLYKKAVMDIVAWLKFLMLGRFERAFTYETELRFFVGFFSKRCRDHFVSRRLDAGRQISGLARSVVNRLRKA